MRALAVVTLTGSACSAPSAPSLSVAPPPQVSGDRVVEGLSAPVTVHRDRWGVPHIEASTQDDLFFAQGYVQAQDRLFQMDLWRRSVQGRLAEVMGATFIARDAMTKRIRYRGDPEDEWASYGPDTRAIVDAFVRGINARVREVQGDLTEDFELAGWAPEEWAPEDLFNRVDAFLASGNAQDEILRARLVAAVGPAAAEALWPSAEARTSVPSGLDPASVSPAAAEAFRRVGTAPFFIALAAPGAEPRAGAAPGGSNAWAVSGARTDTGAPLLAADPHRLLANPSLRYLVHLSAPGWNVAGATAPWLPGVVIGHNERIAWGMTAVSVDTQDVYLERINPENPSQVWHEGRWIDMTTERNAIDSIGREEPFEYDVQFTPRGVVAALDSERQLAYVLRWSGTEPGSASELAALAINRATSWAEFRDAVDRWRMPAVEFVYADIDGHIARIGAAAEPVRRGWSGGLPAPGWTALNDWSGWADRGMPDLDPASGVVVSANGDGARVGRIIDGLDGVLSVDDLSRMQQDVLSLDAEALVPLLEDIDVTALTSRGQSARRRLLGWDRRMIAGSADARLFAVWSDLLLERLVALRVPPPLVSSFLAGVDRAVLVSALVNPTRSWFDGNVHRTRNALLGSVLGEAARRDDVLAEPLGRVLFAHPLAITDTMRARYDVGPFDLSGWKGTVRWLSGTSPDRMVGPSLRLVFDVGNWDRSVATQAPGQSGHPDSPHFADLAALWARGEYFSLPYSADAVRAAAVNTLRMVPPAAARVPGR